MTNHGATLNGTVNPNGAETTVSFEYGLTEEFGLLEVLDVLPAGYDNVYVSVPVTLLEAETEYYFRVVAENVEGISYGETLTFVTLVDDILVPTVFTLPATDIR